MQFKETYSFDDVLLKPKFSKIKSREQVDLSVNLSKGLSFKCPLVPANMKSTFNNNISCIMTRRIEGLSLAHRFMSLEEQLSSLFLNYSSFNCLNNTGISIGVKQEDYDNLPKIIESGVKIICIDIAHGDSENCVEMCNFINKNYPEIFLIAGNVCTGTGANRLWRAGADMVKVNVGAGSICTTRINTGNGIPQISALIDVYEEKKAYREFRDKFIMADGGCKSSGDCLKSLCFSDMVMSGNLFAGTEEGPGEIVEIDGKRYKSYVGSSTHKTSYIEGVKAMVPYKGKFEDVMETLLQGIRSGCSYQGVNNLTDLRVNPEFVKVSNAGIIESGAHNVILKE